MAKKRTRLKAKVQGDRAKVTCLIKHPMETGNRKGDDGQLVPIHYIKFVNFSVNGEHVCTANLGPGVSTDPLVNVDILGVNAGDMVKAEWEDNTGDTDVAEGKAK